MGAGVQATAAFILAAAFGCSEADVCPGPDASFDGTFSNVIVQLYGEPSTSATVQTEGSCTPPKPPDDRYCPPGRTCPTRVWLTKMTVGDGGFCKVTVVRAPGATPQSVVFESHTKCGLPEGGVVRFYESGPGRVGPGE